MTRTCTRIFEFDSAHRVMRHESKCAHMHGHRYKLELTVESGILDPLGRVIDFSVLKEVVGKWIDDYLDHGTILNQDDTVPATMCQSQGWKQYLMVGNPTAENLAEVIFDTASSLLTPYFIRVSKVRLYETPNCYAEYP